MRPPPAFNPAVRVGYTPAPRDQVKSVTPTRSDAKSAREAVHSALLEEAVRITALVERASRLKEWVELPLPADIRDHLRRDLDGVAHELLDVLVRWNRRGGQVSFTPPIVPELVPAPAVVPVIQVVPPPAAAPPPPAPVGPPASTESLKGLAEKFKQGPTLNPEPPAGWADELVWALSTLGSPGEDDEAELDRLSRVLDKIEKWKGFPRLIQRDLVGLCTCRLRRLQDERGIAGSRLDEAFSTLSGWSRKEQPGYVNGLSRGHLPTRGSWTEDVESFLSRLQAPVAAIPRPNQERLLGAVEAVLPELAQAPNPQVFEAVRAQLRRAVRLSLDGGVSARDPRLVKLLAPFVNEIDGPEYRNLRRAIREENDDAVEEADDEKVSPIPLDWAWWGRTRGRRGILVGGDPREPNRLRLLEAFEFDTLDWEPAEHRRNSLMAVRDRVRAGKVDIVIILGAFVGHDADEIILPACRETGVDWVHLDKGYGVVRMRRAIERFLDPLKS